MCGNPSRVHYNRGKYMNAVVQSFQEMLVQPDIRCLGRAGTSVMVEAPLQILLFADVNHGTIGAI